jgi:hypothetical protein
VATPNWDGATAGQPTLAAQINQFMGTHTSQFLYAATQVGAQTTLGAGSTNTNSLYLAQTFTTPGSPTNVGRVVIDLSSTLNPNPAILSIQATTGGAPSGTPLVSVAIPKEYVATTHIVTIPSPVALSASTQYWIVINAVGDASNFYSWFKSNQVTGASTSTNGTSWTAQAYGFYYAYFDQSIVLPIRHTWEDSGARWTQWGYSGTKLSILQEYTVAQGSNQYLYSNRTLTYSGNFLTTIT